MFQRVIDRVRAVLRREPVAVAGLVVAVTGAVDEVLAGGTVNPSDVWKPLVVAVGTAVVRHFVSPTPTVAEQLEEVQGRFDGFGVWKGPQ